MLLEFAPASSLSLKYREAGQGKIHVLLPKHRKRYSQEKKTLLFILTVLNASFSPKEGEREQVGVKGKERRLKDP